MDIEYFDREAPSEEIVAALLRDGAAIVRDQVSGDVADAVLAELRPNFDGCVPKIVLDSKIPQRWRRLPTTRHLSLSNTAIAQGFDRDQHNLRDTTYFDKEGRLTESDFNGYRTLRTSGTLARSCTSAELIGHARVLEVADAVLLPHCINYQLGSTTAIEILPGESEQFLHTDDAIYPLRVPGLQLQVSAMWPLVDFTLENGATRLVPRSHVIGCWDPCFGGRLRC
jgi:ectoine hydroxylase-related dioxygenase (phytanoyl-CoA dioxygenase family)